jgi:pyridoxal 5'-phosphate synthase pdxT subunit
VKVGVLGLQGDVREHVRALEASGATALIVKTAAELASVNALVLPGGESTTIGKLLHRFGLLDLLRERAGDGMPLYGTCAGLILLARDVVGDHHAPHRIDLVDVAVRRNAYGRQVESFETDLDIANMDEPFRAVFIRAPVIESVGGTVEVLAEHEGRPVLVRQGRVLGSTFHPEMTGDVRIHELFVDMARD